MYIATSTSHIYRMNFITGFENKIIINMPCLYNSFYLFMWENTCHRIFTKHMISFICDNEKTCFYFVSYCLCLQCCQFYFHDSCYILYSATWLQNHLRISYNHIHFPFVDYYVIIWSSVEVTFNHSYDSN